MKNLLRFFVSGLFMIPALSSEAATFTLSDQGLMALDMNHYAHYVYPPSVVTIAAKRDVPGPGVEFDIWYPGNNYNTNCSILWASSSLRGSGVLKGIDISQYNSFALDITLLSVNGSAGSGVGGPLIVGAAINQTNSQYAYQPQLIGFAPYRTNTQAVSTTTTSATTISTVGFQAGIPYWWYTNLADNPWSVNGSLVTLLIKAAPGATQLYAPPTSLSATRSNAFLSLSWPANLSGAVLQVRDGLDGGLWTNVGNQTNPMIIPVDTGSRFYRLWQSP